MIRFLLGCIMLPMSGQIPTVALAPQGAAALKDATGRIISGFQLVGVEVTAPGACTFDGAQVYASLASASYTYRGENVTTLNLKKAATRSWQQVTLAIATVLSAVGSIATGADLVNFGNPASRARATAWFAIGTAAGAAGLPFLKTSAPDPSSILADLVLSKTRYTAPLAGYVGAAWPSPPAAVVPLVGGCK